MESANIPTKARNILEKYTINAFDAVPLEFVKNYCAHVEEQETCQILLDGIEELPFEEIGPVDETPKECITTFVEGALAFSDGQVLVAEDVNIGELVSKVMPTIKLKF